MKLTLGMQRMIYKMTTKKKEETKQEEEEKKKKENPEKTIGEELKG